MEIDSNVDNKMINKLYRYTNRYKRTRTQKNICTILPESR